MKIAYCLSDMGKGHLMTADKMWIKLTDLVPLTLRRLNHQAFGELLSEVSHYGTLDEAKRAEMTCLAENRYVRVFRVIPGMSLRKDPLAESSSTIDSAPRGLLALKSSWTTRPA